MHISPIVWADGGLCDKSEQQQMAKVVSWRLMMLMKCDCIGRRKVVFWNIDTTPNLHNTKWLCNWVSGLHDQSHETLPDNASLWYCAFNNAPYLCKRNEPFHAYQLHLWGQCLVCSAHVGVPKLFVLRVVTKQGCSNNHEQSLHNSSSNMESETHAQWVHLSYFCHTSGCLALAEPVVIFKQAIVVLPTFMCDPMTEGCTLSVSDNHLCL